ncbi:hypothetical protein MGH68_13925 [Erysipelothrix sp. D19-032]
MKKDELEFEKMKIKNDISFEVYKECLEILNQIDEIVTKCRMIGNDRADIGYDIEKYIKDDDEEESKKHRAIFF